MFLYILLPPYFIDRDCPHFRYVIYFLRDRTTEGTHITLDLRLYTFCYPDLYNNCSCDTTLHYQHPVEVRRAAGSATGTAMGFMEHNNMIATTLIIFDKRLHPKA